jgi:hypothetical protein
VTGPIERGSGRLKAALAAALAAHVVAALVVRSLPPHPQPAAQPSPTTESIVEVSMSNELAVALSSASSLDRSGHSTPRM